MDGSRGIMLSEISQSEKQKPYDFTHMWNLRNRTNEQRGKKETNHKTLNYREQMVTRREVGR